MNAMRDTIFRGSARGRTRGGKPTIVAAAIAALFLLAGTAGAQEPPAEGSDDELFGSETVTEAAAQPDAAPQAEFIKYDQVKVGGSITGKVGFTSAWASAWDGNAGFLAPTDRYLSPDLEGKVTIVAKPSSDFGVNMDFRTSWPFSTTDTVATTTDGVSVGGADSVTIPNISVWALYSKFNWRDEVYFTFGKQPLAWGVSKGAFQPADDIFALSPDIDLTDTDAEREGPVSLKTTIPLGPTKNFYIYAGLPSDSEGSVKIDPADARLAVKGEFGFGDTEIALGAYYAYSDYPRLLAMATTGIGQWNLYGEGVLKYGSERYFISKSLQGAQESGEFYFTGTLGGYYSNSDSGLTLAFAYLYNGEGQRDVNASELYSYYILHPDEIDRMKVGSHYAFASLSLADIASKTLGDDTLGASLIVISNISDLSGYIMPSLTWEFFDYASLKIGATFSFGDAGDEYITYGVGQTLDYTAMPTKPGVALNLTLTVGTGSF